jgi:hypothetical protein
MTDVLPSSTNHHNQYHNRLSSYNQTFRDSFSKNINIEKSIPFEYLHFNLIRPNNQSELSGAKRSFSLLNKPINNSVFKNMMTSQNKTAIGLDDDAPLVQTDFNNNQNKENQNQEILIIKTNIKKTFLNECDTTSNENRTSISPSKTENSNLNEANEYTNQSKLKKR